jgi:glycosyltransferase involved in cell wall biosynthesis
LKKVFILVTSDIISDQRVHRTAQTLADEGYNVTAVGRKLPETFLNNSKSYKIHLLKLPFRSGPLFYATFNIWAFVLLLFKSFDLLHVNDLDALLAGRLVCVIKRKPLVYDSHELFTELPELINRKWTRKTWLFLEKFLVKNLKYCSTVSNGVANALSEKYGLQFEVIRNLPLKKEQISSYNNSKTIIYQGALNVGRGIDKMIKAMVLLPDFNLTIVGTGTVDAELKKLAKEFNVDSRVTFLGRIPHEKLHPITCMASLGISIEEDMGLNYRFALPNKLFDYIQAGLPVLTTNLPEMESIVKHYNVGETIESNCTPEQLANKIATMLNSFEKLDIWRQNSINAANILCWDNEKMRLINLISIAIKNN